MRLRITIFLAFGLVLLAQWRGDQNVKPKYGSYLGCAAPSNDVLRAEYQKSLDDVRELYKLANDLKTEFEKNDPHVVSFATLKESEDAEKVSKRIHGRLKRCW
jgi:hypothetical protein